MTNRFFLRYLNNGSSNSDKSGVYVYVFMGKEHGKDINEPCWSLLTGRAGEPGVHSMTCT